MLIFLKRLVTSWFVAPIVFPIMLAMLMVASGLYRAYW